MPFVCPMHRRWKTHPQRQLRPYDLGMPGAERLKKSIRLGALRSSGSLGSVFKPVASIGLSKDGGIFVAPAPVLNDSWNYGVIGHDRPRTNEVVLTAHRPKLHYHRSGIVSATLTGTELEHRSLRLPPLEDVTGAQVLSITSVRPWQLASALGDRKGDVCNVVRSWPQSIAFSLSVVITSQDAASPRALQGLAPLGLVPGDPSAFTVSLRGYGLEALLIGRSGTDYTQTPGRRPGVSVTALRWSGESADSIPNMFSLWSSALPNPHIIYEDRVDLPRSDGSDLVVRNRPRRPLA